MKKLLSLIVVLTLVCSMLCGCMAMVGDVKINKNGSGSGIIYFGYSKYFLELLAEENDLSEKELSVQLNQRDKRTINGIKYYGEEQKIEFATIDEFNEGIFEYTGTSSYLNRVKLMETEYGTLKLVVAFDKDADEVPEYSEDVEMTEEEFNEIINSFAFIFNLSFDKNVVKTYGPDVDGVEVNGKKLSMDIVKILKSMENSKEVFVFETVKDAEKSKDKILKFTDVVKNQWFYHPVMTVANGGLVQGKGNGIFDPEVTLTYAEFCQLLAKIQDMEYGEENGYWAAKAIKSCVDEGYINDLGEVNSAIYDVPITREAAIAAIARTQPLVNLFGEESVSDHEWIINKESIPDYDMISAEYQKDVLAAYRLNITTGKDANMTFDPKGTLTRAEVCQLLYNISCLVAL